MTTKKPTAESSSAEAPMEIEKTSSSPVETRWSCTVLIIKKFDSISLQHIDGLKNSVSRLFSKPDYD